MFQRGNLEKQEPFQSHRCSEVPVAAHVLALNAVSALCSFSNNQYPVDAVRPVEKSN